MKYSALFCHLKRYRNIIIVAFRNRRSSMIITLLIIAVCLLTQCIDENATAVPAGQYSLANSAFNQFSGSDACASCHKDIYDKHLKTAHYLSTRPALEKYIKGPFTPGNNSYKFEDNLEVRMEKRKDSFFQVVYVDGVEKRSERFDVVVGSSVKGQTYLHWNRSELVQLPITWFEPARQWSNSPGYASKLLFNRPISSRCLECHTTYVYKLTEEPVRPELYHDEQIVYGIDCEKCHGPAAKHVEFHRGNNSDSARFIINPAHLTRQQNLDLCALCHGGRLTKTKPSFSFTAGESLKDYFTIDTAGRSANDIDVHGNQFGLMAASQCFQNSNMTCTSCHSPHEKEKGNLELFSRRCMNCHGSGHEKVCKLTATAGAVISKNCIDCHMPKQPSGSIAVLLEGKSMPTPVMMRTHFVKAYPDATKKVLDLISNKSK